MYVRDISKISKRLLKWDSFNRDHLKNINDKDRKKEEVLHVKVEPALKEAVSRKAKKESRTVSNAVRKVLIDWVKDK